MARTGLAATTAASFVLTRLAAGEEPESSPPAGPARQVLAFGEAPVDWKARPAGAKPFICDFDLPAAEGDPEGAQVNALLFPMGFEDYRAKISRNRTAADGTPLKPESLPVETLSVGDLKVRIVELSGTVPPENAAQRTGWKLVAAHVRAPAGTGASG